MRNLLIPCLLAFAVGACNEPQTMAVSEAEAARAALEQALPAPEETVALTFRIDALTGSADDVVKTIDGRLRSLGLGSAAAAPGDPPRIVCRVREGDEAHRFRVIGLITSPGTLAFRVVEPERATAEERTAREKMKEFYVPSHPSWSWIPMREGDSDLLVAVPELGGPDDFTERDLASAEPVDDAGGYGWSVRFEIADARREAFEAFTERNLKRQLAIVLDGQVEAAPVIQSALPGFGMISGGPDGFSKERAHAIALVLGSGPSYEATLVLESVVEPESE